MSEFVYLFRSGYAEYGEAMGTPERAQRSMESWMAWVHQLEAGGHLKERGQPLERTGKVVRGPQKTVVDGPYAETKDLVLGFMVVQAQDLAQAVEVASGCPMVDGGGGSVEVRPVLPSIP